MSVTSLSTAKTVRDRLMVTTEAYRKSPLGYSETHF